MRLRSEYLLYAAACIAMATLLGAFNAYLVVAMDSPVAFDKFLGFYWFSWALGLVVPGQVGDVASLTYLMKRAGLSWPRIMARAMLDKFISFSVMVLLAAIAVLRYAATFEVDKDKLIWTAAIVLVAAAAAVHVVGKFLLRPTCTSAWADKVRTGLRELARFVRGNPGLVGINFAGTTLKIILIGTAYWYTFQASGAQHPPWLDVVLLVTVSSLVAYIPVSFNGLGTVEVTGILLFSLLGLGEELVLSSYLVLRLTVLGIAWAPSLLILLISGKHGR